jgi:predicted aldo/keto reductase-like oxidoreductase
MCQIQYNYFDENSQAGVIGLKAAAEKGIPVVIMEPLRGGKLVNMLPENAKKAMKESGRDWSPAEWSFRWLFNQPEVTVVLSGMNTSEMVHENCRTADSAGVGDFTDKDLETLKKVTSAIREKEKVGCTGCRYCMPCPKGVDIPGIFRCYNAMYIEGKSEGRFQFAQTVGLTKEPAFADQCVECGKCEKHCPQNIPIREKLKEADRALRPLPYKVGIAVARKFMFRKTRKTK